MIKIVTDESPRMIEIQGNTKDIMSELAISVIAVLHNMDTVQDISINQKCLDWADLIRDIVCAGHAEEFAKALDEAKKTVVDKSIKFSRRS